MRTILLPALAFLSLLAAPVRAEDSDTIKLPPAGHTILNMSVTEHARLTQDTLSATLRYELDGGSANEIQDKINKAVAEAIAEAKNYGDVKTTTGNYYVHVYNEGEIIDPRTGQPMPSGKKWRGTQSIDLESASATKLLELAGKIQTMGFLMNGLNYSLSTDKAKSAQDDLMQKALTQLGAKAKLAATAMGKGSYDILDVTIDGAGAPPPYPVYKHMAMRAEAAVADVQAPSAEAGETEVSLTVNARVLLKP